MKRQKEHRNLLSALSKGDEVVTAGGVLGKVVDASPTPTSPWKSPKPADKPVEVRGAEVRRLAPSCPREPSRRL